MLEEENVISEFQTLMHVVVGYEEDEIQFKDLVSNLHEYGFAFVLLMFSLPSCIPIPMAGVTPILAAPLFFIAVQMIANRNSPWLPKWLKKKTASKESLIHIITKVSDIMLKIRSKLKILFPFHKSKRISQLSDYVNSKDTISEQTIGLFTFIFATSIAVPLPFTNFFPGVGIFLMSKGLLNKNNLLMIFGMLVGIFGTLLTILILIIGEKAIKQMFFS